MNDYKLVEGNEWHPYEIMGRMRATDYKEVYFASGMDPYAVMLKSWRSSSARWAIIVNGRVECVCGITTPEDLGDVGVPWLLGTNEVTKDILLFVRKTRECIRQMLNIKSQLANFVDKENTESVKWLKWMGFKILEPVPFGPFDKMFHPFCMVK
ncbi:hypothetical protein KAR91_23835 [Candidatus Pacearchaeota archaeon]|nr:hypothetical protein [Candidatus Pacearchaeota archaeon]